MQWTEQGGRGLRPRPSCGVNNIGIYGHGVGLSLFGLGGTINSKSVNKPLTKFGTFFDRFPKFA